MLLDLLFHVGSLQGFEYLSNITSGHEPVDQVCWYMLLAHIQVYDTHHSQPPTCAHHVFACHMTSPHTLLFLFPLFHIECFAFFLIP